MKVFHTIPENRKEIDNAVVTIGTFDGVHRGHRQVIDTLLDTAKKLEGEPVIVTFSNHPRTVLGKGPEDVLTTPDEKVSELYKAGVNTIIMLTFTLEMSRLSAEKFLTDYLVRKLDMQAIVMGYDHAFGKNREGDSSFLENYLERYGISMVKVKEQKDSNQTFSSSRIRNFLSKGDVVNASAILGRNYSLRGHVEHGEGRGRSLGFPTANITPNMNNKLVPGDGVYAVHAEIDGSATVKAVCNIGKNPTFSGAQRTIEVHVPGLDRELYGSEVVIQFVGKIRDEMKFTSSDELVSQIRRDIASSEKIFSGK